MPCLESFQEVRQWNWTEQQTDRWNLAIDLVTNLIMQLEEQYDCVQLQELNLHIARLFDYPSIQKGFN